MTEQIFTFNLPDIGEGVVEGEVIEWLKKVGDPVKKDEPVVVVMTDKATVELPATYPGIISKQYVLPGKIAIKDKPLYDITLDPNSAIKLTSEKTEAIEPLTKQSTSKTPIPCPKTSLSSSQMPSKALAIPKVRQLAAELGVDLERIQPTGKHGEVTAEDLKSQMSTSTAKSIPIKRYEGDEEQPLMGVRGLMARKMDQFRVPQFSYFEQVEVTRLIQLREKAKTTAIKEGVHLSFMPFFISALAFISQQYPQINSSLDIPNNTLILHKQLNIGMAMATPTGLVVPVLKGLQEMKLKEIVDAYEALKLKAQAGKLTSADMKDATLTLSNFGAVGDGLWATPMITPPEVAILAVARITKAPVVRNEEIVVRDMLTLSWSFDHRVIDGELAAKISHAFCVLLRDPLPLLN